MDYKQALDYINGVQWLGSKPGLERVGELLHKLGDPQQKLKFIHIAGTNGKGSCAAMMASVLKTCGYKTGLFTSPYLYRFNERMKINGKDIADDMVVSLVERIQPLADSMEDHPTEFEIMTAAAILWYAEENCDAVVFEVGLGGRFDATNIIEKSEVSIIMNIGLDHTAILGDTLEKIAFEKAGIIKPNGRVVLYKQSENVEKVIRGRCEELGAELVISEPSKIKTEFDSIEGQVFTYKNVPYAIPLLGAHQLKNAAVVLEAVELLRRKGWKLEQSEVEHGLYAVSWPARFEVLSDEPYFVVDGGHNPQCAETVRDNLLRYFPGKKHVIMMGVLRDKDYMSLAETINEAADEYICVTPANDRALPAEELKAALEKFGKKAEAYETIDDAVAAALKAAGKKGVACAVGSLYMAGDIRACFNMY